MFFRRGNLDDPNRSSKSGNVIAKENIVNISHHLYLWQKSEKQLGIVYELQQLYYFSHLQWTVPKSCFFYKEKLFFVEFGFNSKTIEEREWLYQKFDELFYNMETSYIFTYDMNKSKWFCKELYTVDYLKINFVKDINGFTVTSKDLCIENKRDFYDECMKRSRRKNEKKRLNEKGRKE